VTQLPLLHTLGTYLEALVARTAASHARHIRLTARVVHMHGVCVAALGAPLALLLLVATLSPAGRVIHRTGVHRTCIEHSAGGGAEKCAMCDGTC
jgi:hypothetical protein